MVLVETLPEASLGKVYTIIVFYRGLLKTFKRKCGKQTGTHRTSLVTRHVSKIDQHGRAVFINASLWTTSYTCISESIGFSSSDTPSLGWKPSIECLRDRTWHKGWIYQVRKRRSWASLIFSDLNFLTQKSARHTFFSNPCISLNEVDSRQESFSLPISLHLTQLQGIRAVQSQAPLD